MGDFDNKFVNGKSLTSFANKTKEYIDNAVSKIDTDNLVITNSISINRKEGTTIGEKSVAVGNNVEASGYYSHAEGTNTKASGFASHAEGSNTEVSGYASHAEGHYSEASGDYSHAEGFATTASGEYSHAEGARTIASSEFQHVQGKYNIEDSTNTYAHIVGNGIHDGYDENGDAIITHSNAHTLDWNGNAWFAGNVKVGADNKELATTDHTHNYAGSDSAGGTANSAARLDIARVTGSGNSANYVPGANRLVVREYGNDCANMPSAHWYHIYTGQGSDAAYNTQLAIGMTTDGLYFRNKNSNTWGSWKKVSVDGHTHSHTLPKSGDWWNDGFVTVGNNGVSEVGKYIDFHHTDTTTKDYSVRLQTNGDNANTLTLPTASGTLCLTSHTSHDYLTLGSPPKAYDASITLGTVGTSPYNRFGYVAEATTSSDWYDQSAGDIALNLSTVDGASGMMQNGVYIYDDNVYILSNLRSYGNLLPAVNDSFIIGSNGYRWQKAYFSLSPSISSDRTLKENIQYVRNNNNTRSIEDVNYEDLYNFVKDDLELATYNLIGNDNKQINFIAQDLLINDDGTDNKVGQLIVKPFAVPTEEEVEENTSADKDGNEVYNPPTLSYDSGNYASVLAGALKEAISKIESQQEMIDNLISRIEELERNN